MPFVALMVVLLAGGVLGLLMFNTQMQQRSFEITKLQKQASTLDATVQGLRTRQQQLQNPQHLAAAAKALGMVVPPNPTFISLTSGRVSGVPVMSSTGDAMQIRQGATPKPSHLNPKPRIVRVTATTETATSTGTTGSSAGSTAGSSATDKTDAKKSASSGAASTSGGARQGRNDRTTNHR